MLLFNAISIALLTITIEIWIIYKNEAKKLRATTFAIAKLDEL
jgi:hypothetical protein